MCSSVDEKLWSFHSHKTSLAELLHCAILFFGFFKKEFSIYLCLSLGVGGSGVRVKAALGIFCDFSFFLLGPVRTNGDETKGGQGSIGIIVERGGG